MARIRKKTEVKPAAPGTKMQLKWIRSAIQAGCVALGNIRAGAKLRICQSGGRTCW